MGEQELPDKPWAAILYIQVTCFIFLSERFLKIIIFKMRNSRLSSRTWVKHCQKQPLLGFPSCHHLPLEKGDKLKLGFGSLTGAQRSSAHIPTSSDHSKLKSKYTDIKAKGPTALVEKGAITGSSQVRFPWNITL